MSSPSAHAREHRDDRTGGQGQYSATAELTAYLKTYFPDYVPPSPVPIARLADTSSTRPARRLVLPAKDVGSGPPSPAAISDDEEYALGSDDLEADDDIQWIDRRTWRSKHSRAATRRDQSPGMATSDPQSRVARRLESFLTEYRDGLESACFRAPDQTDCVVMSGDDDVPDVLQGVWRARPYTTPANGQQFDLSDEEAAI